MSWDLSLVGRGPGLNKMYKVYSKTGFLNTIYNMIQVYKVSNDLHTISWKWKYLHALHKDYKFHYKAFYTTILYNLLNF